MKNEENYLNNMDFEDKAYLLSLLENIYSCSLDNLLLSIKNFNSDFVSMKMEYRTNQYESNGSTNEQVFSGIKIIKVYSLLSIFKEKYFHNEDIENTFTIDCNLVINQCYKILFMKDCSNNNLDINNENKELNIIINAIFSKYIDDDINSFSKFKNFVDGNKENLISVNLNYENFQKYFRTVVKFYIFENNFKYIYKLLEKKEKKILTTELIVTLNKICRGLSETNIFYIIAKKFIELIGPNLISLTKTDYYIMCIRSLNI